MVELTNDQLRFEIFSLINELEWSLTDENSTKYMVDMVLKLRNYTKTLFERLEHNA